MHEFTKNVQFLFLINVNQFFRVFDKLERKLVHFDQLLNSKMFIINSKYWIYLIKKNRYYLVDISDRKYYRMDFPFQIS